MVAAGNGSMVCAVGVDDPKIGVALVGHRIGEAADVHDFFAVRRNLRVDGGLNLKFVHDGERVGRILRHSETRQATQRNSCNAESSAAVQFHEVEPPRRRGVNNVC